MSQHEYVEIDESDDGSDADSCRTDDSEQEDPSFDLLEETRSRFSNLSVKRKSASCSRIVKKMNTSLEEGEVDGGEVIMPELDEKDQISFETVQKIIEVGQVEKLKLEQCKVYLRKHGLRLTGNKDILLQRIKEHHSIMNGEGEKKYPASSFVMNCKGDACTGDIVMFEQNVYEMFNIASRSATGPPCGTRLVVGRIVKESYGAAKQQHTFTIEVLWSKGMKPLPTLHPLLIKGRNLYRLKTMRQRWEDEGERRKILFEKHTRGSVARSSREARIQEKEMRKTLKENRVLRLKDQNGIFEENKRKASEAPPHNSGIFRRQPNEEQVIQNTDREQTFQQKKPSPLWKENSWVPPPEALHRVVPTVFPGRIEYKENVSSYLSMGLLHNPKSSFGGPIGKQPTNFNTPKSPLRMSFQNQQRTNINYTRSQFQGYDHEGRMSSNRFQSPLQRQNFQECNNGNATSYGFQGQGHEQKQLCRYYPQGRCYYGDRCKYLH